MEPGGGFRKFRVGVKKYRGRLHNVCVEHRVPSLSEISVRVVPLDSSAKQDVVDGFDEGVKVVAGR